MARLRSEFERILGSGCPVRVALEGLEKVEEVRVIEGKG